MNTAGLTALGAKAKPIAEAIARLCEQEGIGVEFSKGGKHPYALITYNRQSRKVFFAGTSANFRTIDYALRDTKAVARQIGWEPRKEIPMEVPVLKSLSDLPKLVEPAPEPHSVEIRLPRPNDCPPQIGRNTMDPVYKAACKKRNEWVFNRFEEGWDAERIYKGFTAAGWEAKSSQNMYAYATFHRKEAGIFSRDPNKKPAREKPAPKDAPRHEPEVEHRAPAGAIDPLVLAIAEAIAPLVREQLAKQSRAIEALKAKADKWDAISGLVRDA